MRDNRISADDDGLHRDGTSPRQRNLRPRWWRGLGVDLFVRIIGTAIAAAGALFLYLLGLHIERHPSAALAIALGCAGSTPILGGAALALIGTRSFLFDVIRQMRSAKPRPDKK